MSATLRNGLFVMYFLCRNKSALLLTLLAERVLTDVSVTDAFPGTAVLLVDVRVTLILVVLSAGYGSVVGTILSIRKVGTAGIRTWSFGFSWHGFTSYGIVRPACT
jgi:hypothetical protein